MIVIISGTYQQYTEYLVGGELSPEKYRRIDTLEKLQGLDKNNIEGYILVGYIYDNPINTQLISFLESKGVNHIQD